MCFVPLRSFGFVKLEPGARPGLLSCSGGAAQLRQCNVLHLTNSLAWSPQILAYSSSVFGFPPPRPKPLRDDSFLALIEDIEKPVHLTE